MTNREIRDRILADYPEVTFVLGEGGCEALFAKNEIILNRERFHAPTEYFLFVMLHELGHLKNNTLDENRSSSEFDATIWALEHADDYGIWPCMETVRIFQKDVYKWRKVEKYLGVPVRKKKELTFHLNRIPRKEVPKEFVRDFGDLDPVGLEFFEPVPVRFLKRVKRGAVKAWAAIGKAVKAWAAIGKTVKAWVAIGRAAIGGAAIGGAAGAATVLKVNKHRNTKERIL